MHKKPLLLTGNCLEALKLIEDNSIDSIVTDPPYGLSNHKPAEIAAIVENWVHGRDDAPGPKGRGFMGQEWDAFVPGPEVWRECLRVLKPGGHALIFAGSRTVDLMGLAVRLAGFEIRDQIQWIYSSGFPKSLNISKAIDKAAGAEREVLGVDHARHARLKNQTNGSASTGGQWVHGPRSTSITAPATEAAKQWDGWGTALKPAHEPVIVARKPLTGTVAANVLEHGAGGINVDGCRISTTPDDLAKLQASTAAVIAKGGKRGESWKNSSDLSGANPVPDAGRWPANVILDEEAGEILGERARFFYCPKASKREREAGLDEFDEVRRTDGREKDIENPRLRTTERRNHHPTVKPIDLMRYLVRLVTPKCGRVLDPFMGSGTTGCAAALEGFEFVGCELSPEYVGIAKARIAHWAETVDDE